MKKIIFILMVLSGFTYANDGEKLYNQFCASCHSDGARTLAPPIFGVINHLKQYHNSKEEFTNAVISWVNNPQQEKSIMLGAIKKFGIMPKLAVATKDVREIADFMYNYKKPLPNWYKKHYQEEHGNYPK